MNRQIPKQRWKRITGDIISYFLHIKKKKKDWKGTDTDEYWVSKIEDGEARSAQSM